MNTWCDMIDQPIPKCQYNSYIYHNLILPALFWDMFAIPLIVHELIVITKSFIYIKMDKHSVNIHSCFSPLRCVYGLVRTGWINATGMEIIWGLVCQKQVLRAGKSNYIPQYMWDVIICPCLWYLHLVQISHISLAFNMCTVQTIYSKHCIF